MSKNKLKTLLENSSARREERLFIAAQVLSNPDLFSYLLELSLEVSYEFHYKAAWALEFVWAKKPEYLFPYIDFFTQNLYKIKHESAIRPLAKICKQLAEIHTSNALNKHNNILKSSNINEIIEVSFDWMIEDTKVASKVYSMDTLYHFGSLTNPDFQWIHPALKELLIKNIGIEPPAYKAHAKKVLRQLQL